MGAGARGSGGAVRGTAWSWQAAEHSRRHLHVAVLLSKKLPRHGSSVLAHAPALQPGGPHTACMPK